MRSDPAGSPLPNRTRRRVQIRHMLAAVSGLALLLAAGCSSRGGGGTSPVAETIKIAAVPGVDDAPLWLAQEKGLFAAAGLHVQIETFGNGSDAAQLAAVESGQAQIAASDYGNIFATEVSSSNLHLLADGYDAGTGNVEILLSKHSGLTTPAQLHGVTIGVPNNDLISSVGKGHPESLNEAAATESISDYLLSGALQLSWKPMSQQDEVAELESGQLQAAMLTEPYIYQAEAGFGAFELMDVFSGQTENLPLSGYVSTAPWAKQNPAAVADFQSALTEAQSDAAMVGPVQQTLHKAADMSVATADMVSLGTYPTVTSTNALQRVVLLMNTENMLNMRPSTPAPVSELTKP